MLHRSERGFSIVEIIVAMVVLTLVGSAVAAGVVSSQKAGAKAKVASRQYSVAEAAFEFLQSDPRWARTNIANCHTMAPTATSVNCTSSVLQTLVKGTSILKSPKTGAYQFQAAIKAVGYDSEADDTGANDVDGLRPDYYAVDVTVTVIGNPGATPVKVSGTIDPAGRASRGALTIQACVVERQYDERLPIGACPVPRDRLMAFPALNPFGSAGASSAANQFASRDWGIALDLAKGSIGSAAHDRLSMGVRPIQTQLTIKKMPTDIDPVSTIEGAGLILPAGQGCSWNASRIKCNSSVQKTTPQKQEYPTATITIGGLKPGLYSIDAAVPSGYEAWDHESVPTGGIAIVEVAKRTRVLKVFKPKIRYTGGAGYAVGLRNCDAGPYFYTICNPGLKYGISAWLAVSTVGRTEWSCETDCTNGATPASAPAGANYIHFHNLRPGLYQRGLVFPLNGAPNPDIGRICPWSEPDSNSCPNVPDWMWIDSINAGIGSDQPVSGDGKWTQFWCNPATRNPAIAIGAAMDPPVIIQPCGSGGGGGGGLGMGGAGGA
jgi:type II secretory pathway pseudopilin PulG